jgi:hypothetical protein
MLSFSSERGNVEIIDNQQYKYRDFCITIFNIYVSFSIVTYVSLPAKTHVHHMAGGCVVNLIFSYHVGS